LIAAWGGCLFLVFAAIMVLQFFVVWKFLPETKGRSLEEIEASMH